MVWGVNYLVADRPGDGLALIQRDGYSSVSTALWTRGRLRKRCRCAVTGLKLVPGDEAYRPVGNMIYRSERIGAWVIDEHEGRIGLLS